MRSHPRSWLKSRRSTVCARRFRPRLEVCEERTVPATFGAVENTALVVPAAATVVTAAPDGSGAVTLPGVTGSLLSGNSLPAGWQVNPWSSVALGSATVSGGVLTVDGTRVGPQALSGPGESLEFQATFSGDPEQHIGFGTDFSANAPFVIFSTGSGGTLYARSTDGTTEQDTNLGPSWLGGSHDFRIDWTATGTNFWIDGNLVAQQTLAVTAQLRPLVSDFTVGGGVVTVSSMTLNPPGEDFAFTGPNLPAGWTAAPGTVTVGSGQLTVDGGLVGTQAYFSPGRSMKFGATFTGDPFQHIGFGTDFLGSSPFAIFSTGTGGALYARTSNGTTSENVLLPASLLNAPHEFEIDWAATGVTYSVDGTQVDAEVNAPTVALRALVSDFVPHGGTLTVDSMSLSPPFNSSGTFLSRVFDAGATTSSLTGSWSANTPAGTSVTVSVRTGNTPTPDATWTAFTPLNGPVTSPFRYVQYEAQLTTTDLTVAPVLNSVTLTANGTTFTDSQAADFEAGTAGTGLLATAPAGTGTLLTAVLIGSPSNGSVVLNPDGSYTYTPKANFIGTDSFVYEDLAADGNVSAPMTVTLTVTAATPPPVLTITSASGTEGDPVPLTISAAPAVTDGSETLSVTIGGLPAGAVLSAGTLSNGVWTLTPAQLSGLSITIRASGTFNLTVTATALTTATGASSSITATLQVTVVDIPPTAVLAQVGTTTYGQNAVVGFTSPFDPSASDTAAGFHYAFALNASALASATYANSGTASTSAFGPLGAGSYTVYGEIIDQFGGFTQYSTTITIAPATLSVTAVSTSKVYGAANPTFTATISGFVNGDGPGVVSGSPALSTTATTSSGVGTYPITPTIGTLSAANYVFAFNAGTLTITPATPVVAVTDAGGTFAGTPYPASATITGVSGVSGISLEGVSPSLMYYVGSPATGTGSHTAPSAVGTYTVVASFPGSADYTMASASTAFTIAPAPTITTASITGTGAFGQALTVTATVTGPGGTPTGTVAVVDSTTGLPLGAIHLVKGTGSLSISSLTVGQHVLALSYAGDGTYLPSGTTITTTLVDSIELLNSSASGALSLSGSAEINIPGALIVDSKSASALSASGAPSIRAAAIQVAGGVQKSGSPSFSTPPVTGAAVISDPLAGLVLPSSANPAAGVNVSGASAQTIGPGVYSQINVSGSGSLTLTPGVYVIAGGGFSVSGAGKVVGTGVTIFNLANVRGTYGSITVTGSGAVNLTAPTAGPSAGIVVVQPAADSNTIAISGAASVKLNAGVLYAPSAVVNVSGSALFPSTALVASELQMSGAAGFNALNGSTAAYTPDQLRTAYGINNLGLDGTGQTIAIVDAYDNPVIFQAVDAFDNQFGPTSSGPSFYQQYGAASSFLTVVNQSGQTAALPATDPAGAGGPNWEMEEALDVEWIHAVAPGANIVLVEANSPSLSDLMSAVATAADLPDVSVVSMSWGFVEGTSVLAADEALFDKDLMTPAGHQGVTFVASTGDYGAAVPQYPAFSPNVVAIGGTALSLNGDNSYQTESGWGALSSGTGTFVGSGGGISQFEAEPAFQEGVQSTGFRTTPDVSFMADPTTGVWLADPYNLSDDNPWIQVGGTSLAAPAWAGLLALVDQARVAEGAATLGTAGPTEAQTALYSLPVADYHAVTSGTNGYSAGAGYNLVTGLGSPVANLLIPDLASYNGAPMSHTAAGQQQISADGLTLNTSVYGGTSSSAAQANAVANAMASFNAVVIGSDTGRDLAPAAFTVPTNDPAGSAPTETVEPGDLAAPIDVSQVPAPSDPSVTATPSGTRSAQVLPVHSTSAPANTVFLPGTTGTVLTGTGGQLGGGTTSRADEVDVSVLLGTGNTGGARVSESPDGFGPSARSSSISEADPPFIAGSDPVPEEGEFDSWLIG
jgi:hypothetical protein